MIQNPYYQAWKALKPPRKGTSFEAQFEREVVMMKARQEMVHQYAWAIPNVCALNAIAALSPIVEIGAGTGYWSNLLQQMGATIWPFDKDPPGPGGENEYKHSTTFTTVIQGGPEVLDRVRCRTLFLCWPPYDDPMAANCLYRHRGPYVVYIGESEGGCTADEAFHTTLDTFWSSVHHVRIPQWPMVHDSMSIFKRKRRIGRQASHHIQTLKET